MLHIQNWFRKCTPRNYGFKQFHALHVAVNYVLLSILLNIYKISIARIRFLNYFVGVNSIYELLNLEPGIYLFVFLLFGFCRITLTFICLISFVASYSSPLTHCEVSFKWFENKITMQRYIKPKKCNWCYYLPDLRHRPEGEVLLLVVDQPRRALWDVVKPKHEGDQEDEGR